MYTMKQVGASLVAAMTMAVAVSAAPYTWDDGLSGNWTNPANWVEGAVPQAGDDVTLPAGSYTITLDSATAELASYTQNGGTLFFTNWTTALRAQTVTMNDGKMDHAICNTNAAPGVTNRVNIEAVNVTIGANGVIDVTARGFPGTNYKGMGPGGGAVYCWGGSYGGVGGRGHASWGSVTPVYGDPSDPTAPGSGGGGADGSYSGVAGGGAVRIVADETNKVDGTISAGGASKTSGRGGGGSGGSIYLASSVFEGTGTLATGGGDSVGTQYGGGGGGGRIAVIYDTTAQSNANPVANCLVQLAGGRSSNYGKGSPGTLFLPDDQALPDPLPHNAILHFGESPFALNVPSLTLTNFSLGFGSSVALTVDGNVRISADGLDGLSFEDDSTLHVGGDINITNAFLRMEPPALSQAELTCAGDMTLRDAEVVGKDMTINGNVTIFSPGGANGLTLNNDPSLTVDGNILIRTNGLIAIHSWSNSPALLNCAGSMTLNAADLNVYSCPTGTLDEAYGARVKVTGDLLLTNNAWISPRLTDAYNSQNDAGHAVFLMRNLRISDDSGFNGNGRGYAGRSTPNTSDGFGPGGGPYYAGGAGHGGIGGLGHATLGSGIPGPAYGSSNAPVQPGSGGAPASNNGTGGNGGGSVVVEATQAVLVDGAMTVNGNAGNNRGGGGSGGSIYITCQTFSGSGTLAANGGEGGPGNTAYGGGGAGGRIAVHRIWDKFSGSPPSVAPGEGAYENGNPGTLVWVDVPLRGSLMMIQ